MVIKFLGEISTNEPQTAHVTRILATQGFTGANQLDVMSNIYDLEGNNVEWNAQAFQNGIRGYRGSDFNGPAVANKYNPASKLTSAYPYDTKYYRGSRVTLFID